MKSLTSGENTVYFVPSSDAVESIEINLVSQRRAMHGGSRHMDGDCGEAGQNEKQKRLPPPKENRRIPNHSPGDWMRDDDFSWWGKKHSQFDSVSGCGTLGAAWCVPCTLEAGGARSVAPPDLAPRLFPTIHNSILLIACPNPRGQPLRH
jgi:hypothetical protein